MATKALYIGAIENFGHLNLPDSHAHTANSRETVISTKMVLGVHAPGLGEVVSTNIANHVVQKFIWTVLVCDVVAECLEAQLCKIGVKERQEVVKIHSASCMLQEKFTAANGTLAYGRNLSTRICCNEELNFYTVGTDQ